MDLLVWSKRLLMTAKKSPKKEKRRSKCQYSSLRGGSRVQ
uniref:Uncharacterized protein n=1 Tax=Pristionchus pacificus TaxID=54126 RepID=A0A2A6CVT2_PRIPA|eukprot:PDM82295.1 hypothetical protein PRIPAC_36688 [Pristionchus pacificus]